MILRKYHKHLGARCLPLDIHTCEARSLASGWSSPQVYRPFRLWVGSEDLTRPERSICVTSPQHNPNLLRATITPSQALTISSMRCCVERQRFFPMWKAHLNSCTNKYIQSSKDYQEYTPYGKFMPASRWQHRQYIRQQQLSERRDESSKVDSCNKIWINGKFQHWWASWLFTFHSYKGRSLQEGKEDWQCHGRSVYKHRLPSSWPGWRTPYQSREHFSTTPCFQPP